MAKIIRKTGDVKAFGSNATGTNRTVFGADTQSDTLDDNVTTELLSGWQTVSANEKPTLQDFNAAGFTAGQYIAYLHQMGIAEWDGAQQYQINSFAPRGGVIYRCKTADHTSATVPESDATNWESILSEIAASDVINTPAGGIAATTVQAALNELDTDKAALAGATFTGQAKGITPVSAEDFTRKDYVDALNDTETITGSAVFTQSTNNIGLTGIGSIGLAVGDVITVTGASSNNKDFTVEVITDANNIIVNQAHAGGTTTKSLVDQTATATITLLARAKNAAPGMGQGLVSVTRSVNVTYTNNTKRLIFAIVQTAGSFNLTVAGILVANYSESGSVDNMITVPISVDNQYISTLSDGILRWSESR